MVSFDLNRAIEHKVGYRNKSDDAPQFHVFFWYPPSTPQNTIYLILVCVFIVNMETKF